MWCSEDGTYESWVRRDHYELWKPGMTLWEGLDIIWTFKDGKTFDNWEEGREHSSPREQQSIGCKRGIKEGNIFHDLRNISVPRCDVG